MAKEQTPLMKQYYEIKAKYPNTVLLFRMGDFFETFDDDAAITAKICGITLTKRNNGAAEASPLAGFPYHQLDAYLPKLVKGGCRVAVCEQVEDPKKKTGSIVRREVIEVVTPGVSLYDKLLDSNTNNYIAAIYAFNKNIVNVKNIEDIEDIKEVKNTKEKDIKEKNIEEVAHSIGLAICDISTGEFLVGELNPNQIIQTLESYLPSEILYSKAQKSQIEKILTACSNEPLETKLEDWIFEQTFARELLLRQFQTRNFKGFGIDDLRVGISAAGAVLHYIAETQKLQLPQIYSIRLLNPASYMILDFATRRNLEILHTIDGDLHGSLIKLLDKTLTPQGSRLFKRWINQPLNSLDRIHNRLDCVEYFVENDHKLEQLKALLKNFGDLERLVSRISSGKASTRDVIALSYNIEKIPKIIELFSKIENNDIEKSNKENNNTKNNDIEKSNNGNHSNESHSNENNHNENYNTENNDIENYNFNRNENINSNESHSKNSNDKNSKNFITVQTNSIKELVSKLIPVEELVNIIKNAMIVEPSIHFGDGNIFRAGYNKELDSYVQAKFSAKQWISQFQEDERQSSDINSLKVGFNNVFGYYIEITKTHTAKVPSHYERKQTLTNAERYTTPILKDFEAKILNAEFKIVELEQQLFNEIKIKILDYIEQIQVNASIIAQLDCLQSFASVSIAYNYVKPIIDNSLILKVEDGRHPVIERMLPASEKYTPNSTNLDCESEQIHIITGPNMAGKSCYLRQTALIVLLGQIGCFVPAKKAHFGLIDRIFTRVGAQDNITSGESTFLVEMQETAYILNNATKHSLILLDEVGRGTATFDGISIAWSIAEYLHNTLKAKTLFATHYHELNDLAERYERIVNYRAEVIEANNKIVFSHKISKGSSDHSFGIYAAKMAGLPSPVIERAGEIMSDLEKENEGIKGNRTLFGDTNKIKVNKKQINNNQLSIFEFRDDALREKYDTIKEKLGAIDINLITPMQALQILAELKNME